MCKHLGDEFLEHVFKQSVKQALSFAAAILSARVRPLRPQEYNNKVLNYYYCCAAAEPVGS